MWNAFLQRFAAGVPEGIRTSDLSLRRRSLYPTELRAHVWLINITTWRAFCQVIVSDGQKWPSGQFLQSGLDLQ